MVVRRRRLRSTYRACPAKVGRYNRRVIEPATIYLAKAEESLAGAESEFTNGRYNNTANRCYYACFQAAVAALIGAGIGPTRAGGQWSHAFVPAQFDGQLIRRRKLYPSELRNVLGRNYLLRQVADYEEDAVTHTEASRALRRTRPFVEAIRARGGERR
jgi:uncharacterized protein (UPF0332 family)